jgi:hypothetical protein
VVDIVLQVPAALAEHPAVRPVHLVGSRARGTPGPLSDCDLAVDAIDFAAVVRDLPALLAPLQPIAQQWDPLCLHACYMLALPGPVKVDLLFAEPHAPEPPWAVSTETLQAIDDHFWDWLYWLASKHSAGKHDQVAQEFAKMYLRLLGPLGAGRRADTIETAARLYLQARRDAEARLGVPVSRTLESEIRRGLQSAGYKV